MKASSYTFTLVLATLCVTGPSLFGQTSVLFNFESGSVASWSHWSYGSAVDVETTLIRDGAYALRYTHTEGESRYATAWHAAPVTNWSPFGQVSYWARASENTGQNTVKLKFIEAGGEEWIQKVGTVLTTGYQRIEADLTQGPAGGFEVAAGVNWTLELGDVTNVTLVFDAQDIHPPYVIYYYIDDIELHQVPQVAELALSTNLALFGMLLPSPADHRFATDPVFVDYTVSGYTNAWRIELYSTSPGGQPGLVGNQEAEWTLPLKCWSGPTNVVPPDPEVPTNWAEAWSYVTHETNDWHPALAVSTEGPPAAGFQLLFATDAGGAYTQAYSAPVTAELLFE